jgi:transglutaminase-like putative cysteine protease
MQLHDVASARLPASPAFTELRPPHVVGSRELRALAAQIAGDETNPLRSARRLYDWCVVELGYSYAREYSTIECIPAEVLATRRGDCGQLTLLYLTLCRLNGIPARWQSGWVVHPGHENLHDWCEIRIEPWGWIPVDVNTAVETNHADALSDIDRLSILEFAFGSLDSYRLVVNRDHGRPLVPAKGSPRSDDVDFQRGEVEWGTPARNVYYGSFSYSLNATIVK